MDILTLLIRLQGVKTIDIFFANSKTYCRGKKAVVIDKKMKPCRCLLIISRLFYDIDVFTPSR